MKSSLITEEVPCSIQEARPEGAHAQHKDPQFHQSSHNPRSRASEVEHPVSRFWDRSWLTDRLTVNNPTLVTSPA